MNKTILTGRRGYGKSLLMKEFEDDLINDKIKLDKIMYKYWSEEITNKQNR